ncbi:hypothetical protein Y032_0589g368 [Ancylostoma ceylanicum]|uniref:Uncharacterized protein n=1 Tax=Ancylostoma ceylanicum TaxID=53326 RepID=A0A016WNT4_9BILA|nr:hypothetical protein Y032_0589g368 [Ancylostoma ceylanicum]
MWAFTQTKRTIERNAVKRSGKRTPPPNETNAKEEEEEEEEESSLRTLSRRVRPHAHLSMRISAVFDILSCVFDTGQHSLPHIIAGLTTLR